MEEASSKNKIMQKILLTGTDLMISPLGLGCDQLGKSILYDKHKDPTFFLNKCLDEGVNHFDTANVYAYGESEELIGKVAKERRDEMIITTKGGKISSVDPFFRNVLMPFAPLLRPFLKKKYQTLKKMVSRKTNFDPKYLEDQLNNSLKTLSTDHVDIYLLHCPTIDQMKDAKLFKWLNDCKKHGKIRSFGVSVYEPEELDWLLDNEDIDVAQVPYNIQNKSFEKTLINAKTKGTGIIARMVLNRGLLTEKHIKSNDGKLDNELQKVIEEAHTKGLSLEEHAIRTVKNHPNIDTMILGMSKLENLKNNISYFEDRIIN